MNPAWDQAVEPGEEVHRAVFEATVVPDEMEADRPLTENWGEEQVDAAWKEEIRLQEEWLGSLGFPVGVPPGSTQGKSADFQHQGDSDPGVDSRF